MLVRIIFHPLDDLCDENKAHVTGRCILATEADTAHWSYRNNSWNLTFKSDRRHSNVLAGFEEEGFELDEFLEISFRG